MILILVLNDKRMLRCRSKPWNSLRNIGEKELFLRLLCCGNALIHAFNIEVIYEKFPDFCHNCKVIGHHLSRCNKVQQHIDRDQVPKDDKGKKKVMVKKDIQKFVEKPALEKANPPMDDTNKGSKASTSFHFACENVSGNIAHGTLGIHHEPVLQLVMPTTPVVHNMLYIINAATNMENSVGHN